MIAVAGCAQERGRSYGGSSAGKEYFPQGSKYGRASPRVFLEGQRIPKGGGRYLVGRPYRIAGRTYVPSEKTVGSSFTGTASWYGAAFHGRRTANGEVYDMRSITAAHPTMPLPSYVRVTNLKNDRSIVVRVNDRGPYHGGRVMDLSQRVAELLDFRGAGTARIKVDYLGKAEMEGSDDERLAATLSTGVPAELNGFGEPKRTMIAEPAPPPPLPPPAPEPAQAAVPPAPPRAASFASPAEPPAPPRGGDPLEDGAEQVAPEPPRAPVTLASSPPSRPTATVTPNAQPAVLVTRRAVAPAAGKPTVLDEDAPLSLEPPRRPGPRASAAEEADFDPAAAPKLPLRRYAPGANLAERLSRGGAPFSKLRDAARDAKR
jgi:rare lipoprotein A